MEKQKLYKVVELSTNGWHPVVDADYRLTQDQAKARYNELLGEGYSPDRIKVVRIQ